MNRVFVEPKGKFAVQIPTEWLYQNEKFTPNDYIHSFEHYDNPFGCYQISCTSKSVGKIPNLIAENNLQKQQMGNIKLNFVSKISVLEDFKIHYWMAIVGNDFLLVKYIYDLKQMDVLDVKNELNKAKNTIPTIFVIPEERRKIYLKSARYFKFMISMMASLDLRIRAYENNSYIELIILLANYIDASLRLALILKKQILENTDEYEIELLFQAEKDKPLFEKKIYEKALKGKIISHHTYNELIRLYNERNKVVHRFIITDLKTFEIRRLVREYETIEETVQDLVIDLENEQFDKGVGIHKNNNPTIPTELEYLSKIHKDLRNAIRGKHHDKFINNEIKF